MLLSTIPYRNTKEPTADSVLAVSGMNGGGSVCVVTSCLMHKHLRSDAIFTRPFSDQTSTTHNAGGERLPA